MDLKSFFQSECADHTATAQRTCEALAEPFAHLVAAAIATIKAGRTVFFFGNGGSAADAQHLATELTVRYSKNRAPIAAIALTTDSSALTAIGNDLGFDHLFERQIEALGRPGDLAIAITTSGQSANVTLALQMARRIGMTPAALTGRDGGTLPGLADPLLIVPSQTTARIQEMHILIGHSFCDALERELGLV
ncbi:MAG: D-sedoheptulose 7-phosphate isomerase [Acidobacteriaceae bacterium]|nr:D-sedoheptulose 7-phosphate isomerase [Acidobacteriaceae bacterium]